MIYKNYLFQVLCLLMLACSSLSASAEKRFGSWEAGSITAVEGMYAGTMNESKAILGQYCLNETETCYWLLANNINCKEGIEVPVLINYDEAALNQTMLCVKIDGKSRYAFTNFETIDAAIKASARIGIAFPLENGLFQVNRFSLDGSMSAITFMRRAFSEGNTKKNNGTKDKTL